MSDGHAEELLKIADAAADTRVQIQNDDIQKPLKAVQEVCEEVKRAWSGSNLGYHALVYYAGLRPPPPGVEFSPEWGLMNRRPTHEANAGWQAMDYQVVLNEIFRRAGCSNKDSVTIKLAPLRRTFLELQGRRSSNLVKPADLVVGSVDPSQQRQYRHLVHAVPPTLWTARRQS